MTKTLKTCILIASMLILSFCLQACSSGDTVFTVNFTIGEHGTVNDKTGEYTEEIDIEEGYPLIIAADEGYMLDEICVAGDQKGK